MNTKVQFNLTLFLKANIAKLKQKTKRTNPKNLKTQYLTIYPQAKGKKNWR